MFAILDTFSGGGALEGSKRGARAVGVGVRAGVILCGSEGNDLNDLKEEK